jgi:hypothetical protein
MNFRNGTAAKPNILWRVEKLALLFSFVSGIAATVLSIFAKPIMLVLYYFGLPKDAFFQFEPVNDLYALFVSLNSDTKPYGVQFIFITTAIYSFASFIFLILGSVQHRQRDIYFRQLISQYKMTNPAGALSESEIRKKVANKLALVSLGGIGIGAGNIICFLDVHFISSIILLRPLIRSSPTLYLIMQSFVFWISELLFIFGFNTILWLLLRRNTIDRSD